MGWHPCGIKYVSIHLDKNTRCFPGKLYGCLRVCQKEKFQVPISLFLVIQGSGLYSFRLQFVMIFLKAQIPFHDSMEVTPWIKPEATLRTPLFSLTKFTESWRRIRELTMLCWFRFASADLSQLFKSLMHNPPRQVSHQPIEIIWGLPFHSLWNAEEYSSCTDVDILRIRGHSSYQINSSIFWSFLTNGGERLREK